MLSDQGDDLELLPGRKVKSALWKGAKERQITGMGTGTYLVHSSEGVSSRSVNDWWAGSTRLASSCCWLSERGEKSRDGMAPRMAEYSSSMDESMPDQRRMESCERDETGLAKDGKLDGSWA